MGLFLFMDFKKLVFFSGVKQEQLFLWGQVGLLESLGVFIVQEVFVLRGIVLGLVLGGSIIKGIFSIWVFLDSVIIYCGFIIYGMLVDVLYKGIIIRIIGEDSLSCLDCGWEDSLFKGYVIYEGKKGYVLFYEGGMFVIQCFKEDGRSSLGFFYEMVVFKCIYDMMEGCVGRVIFLVSIEGFMGCVILLE